MSDLEKYCKKHGLKVEFNHDPITPNVLFSEELCDSWIEYIARIYDISAETLRKIAAGI